MKVIRKFGRSENAQSLVEFALILPLLLVILLGIVEFGWLFNAKITLTSAAREAVRVYAITGKETDITKLDADIQNAIDRATSTLVLVDGQDVTFDKTGPTALAGNADVKTVSVTVNGNVESLTKFFPFIPSTGLPMNSTASMRIEY